MRKFRTGVVGTGFVGIAHIEALRRLGNVDVVAIADSNGAKEKAEALGIERYFSSYKEMIDCCGLDAVHICTPNNTHCEMVLYAFDHGVNVICEKPLSLTVEEAQLMLASSREKNLVGAVNYHNRFYPMTHHMRQMIAKGSIGDVVSVHGGYLQDWLMYDTDFNWRLLTEESGKTRAVGDIGSHWLDLGQYVTGMRITEVFAEFKTVHPVRKMPAKPIETFTVTKLTPGDYRDIMMSTEDLAVILCRFENGAIGSAFISQVHAGKKNRITMNVAGLKKSLEWNFERGEELIVGYREKANEVMIKSKDLVEPLTGTLISYPAGHTEGFPDAFKHAFSQIYSYIGDRNKPADFARFEDGLYEMKLCDCIYESAHSGKWVKVSFDEFMQGSMGDV